MNPVTLSSCFLISLSLLLSSSLCATADPSRGSKTLKIATTTSIYNSDLLDSLVSVFEKKTSSEINIISVGTGRAIRLAKNGDVDLVIVHDKKMEEDFVKSGFGIDRQEFMYNYFILVGPSNDPAGVSASGNIYEAFKKIAGTKCLFVSRGDESGTDQREKSIFSKIDATKGYWYLEVGQGMEEALIIAEQKRAYCLTDKATFLAIRDKLNLKILFEKPDIELLNTYSCIAVNPAIYKNVNYNLAKEFIDFVISKEIREIIKNFKDKGSDEPLFYPKSVK